MRLTHSQKNIPGGHSARSIGYLIKCHASLTVFSFTVHKLNSLMRFNNYFRARTGGGAGGGHSLVEPRYNEGPRDW